MVAATLILPEHSIVKDNLPLISALSSSLIVSVDLLSRLRFLYLLHKITFYLQI